MKSTGMVRKVDELGRVVIPIELRRSLDINEKDSVEIYIDHEKIILKKYVPDRTCYVTGEATDANISLVDGSIILSPQGAKRLYDEIKKEFNF